MNPDDDTIRELVQAGWIPGAKGKGLLLGHPDRLTLWRVLGSGTPHHLDVTRATGVDEADVLAWLEVSPTGVVALADGPAPGDGLIEARVCAVDERLSVAAPWRFDD